MLCQFTQFTHFISSGCTLIKICYQSCSNLGTAVVKSGAQPYAIKQSRTLNAERHKRYGLGPMGPVCNGSFHYARLQCAINRLFEFIKCNPSHTVAISFDIIQCDASALSLCFPYRFHTTIQWCMLLIFHGEFKRFFARVSSTIHYLLPIERCFRNAIASGGFNATTRFASSLLSAACLLVPIWPVVKHGALLSTSTACNQAKTLSIGSGCDGEEAAIQPGMHGRETQSKLCSIACIIVLRWRVSLANIFKGKSSGRLSPQDCSAG